MRFMTAPIVMLPIIVVVEISLQLHQAFSNLLHSSIFPHAYHHGHVLFFKLFHHL
jgi:hypothetical protein